MGCRVQRRNDWAARIVHEASLHDNSYFLTLTYRDDATPPHKSLRKRDMQLFLKRLRKAFGPFRYYYCGEYSEVDERPHYHAIVFGLSLRDLVFYKKGLWTSPALERLWGHGFVVIGLMTVQAASYVAGYVEKKLTGKLGLAHYNSVDVETGEIRSRTPPYSDMSRRGGVGFAWFERYCSDLYPHDYVVLGGRKRGKPPRYYDKLLEKEQPVVYEAVKKARIQRALEPRQAANSTRARLKVRDTVLRARLALRKRNVQS